MTSRSLLLVAALGTAGCERGGFDPPAEPAHDNSEDGYLHATGYEDPFLCRDPDDRDSVTCPWERPPDSLLSCDASGCHGDFDFSEGSPDFERHLHGSAGPSCYSCHGQEWSDKKER